MGAGILLTMRGVSKSFPGVRALKGVDFTLREGEIHALMGENGAGKSTLIKVLTGVYSKDAGEIRLAGHPRALNVRSPREAQDLGISTVYQEIGLCPNLTVAENMFMGRSKSPFLNWREINGKTARILGELGIPAKPERQLANCSLAVRQMVAIARAVDMNCRALILDEPTSSLDESEVEGLFALMGDLRARGVGIVFVTHFLDQVYRVCDRITVLRNGDLVGEYPLAELPRLALIEKMMGKELQELSGVHAEARDYGGLTPVVEVEGLRSDQGIAPFDFRNYPGEVTGFTGLLGSGRSECVRAIFGADKVTGGRVRVKGKAARITKPLEAMRLGMAYLPEDRARDGIVSDLSVRDNIILALQVMKGFFRPFTRKKATELAEGFIGLLSVKAASLDTPVGTLSGGNQQKVILARWLLTKPDYLILDEPTRGIDVGTKTEIQKLIVRLAAEGMGVTFISSEIEEMLRTCSRLIVLRDRKVVGTVSGSELTQDNVMRTIAEGSASPAGAAPPDGSAA
ncbi:MAG: sugar ABC transporter ATP-binding protein [Deltaproteobacteria bacterium]|jgi:simple sugar transport system ATP-binding protein|nr:sugar ABC transporter ATP-binding protein [Deltaproteobacteria bacterium]